MKKSARQATLGSLVTVITTKLVRDSRLLWRVVRGSESKRGGKRNDEIERRSVEFVVKNTEGTQILSESTSCISSDAMFDGLQ